MDAELYHSVRADAAELNTSTGLYGFGCDRCSWAPGSLPQGDAIPGNISGNLEFSDVQMIPTKDGEYRDLLEVAREKTDWILENHHPEPLSENQQTELTRIVKAAEKEINKE